MRLGTFTKIAIYLLPYFDPKYAYEA